MKSRVPIAAALLLLLATSAASAQGASGFHLGVAGGLSSPTSDARDSFDNGWHAGALLTLTPPVMPVGLRIDLQYHKLDAAGPGGGDAEVVAGTANLVVGFRALVVKPYVLAGGGYYRLDFSEESFPSAFRDRQDEFGWNAGAGVSFSMRNIDIFVEARYHSVQTEGDRFTFVPVSVGLVF